VVEQALDRQGVVLHFVEGGLVAFADDDLHVVAEGGQVGVEVFEREPRRDSRTNRCAFAKRFHCRLSSGSSGYRTLTAITAQR